MAEDPKLSLKYNTPLLSVVIANYNQGQFLESSIESVLNQSCQDFELIIVDGASTDNSVEVIKKYDKYLAWWVSEKDNGQSDAFNKGFKKANGEFFTWLNADDLMLPGTVQKLRNAHHHNRNADWFTGNMVRFLNSNNMISEVAWGPHILPPWIQNLTFFDSVYGPTSFFKKKIYEAVGPISEKFHYKMDTEYWLRLKHQGFLQHRLNHFCWAFRMHVNSKTAEFNDHKLNRYVIQKLVAEQKKINKKYKRNTFSDHCVIKHCFRMLDLSFCRQQMYRAYYMGRDVYKAFNIRFIGKSL